MAGPDEPIWGPDLIVALKESGVIPDGAPPITDMSLGAGHGEFARLHVDFAITYDQAFRLTRVALKRRMERLYPSQKKGRWRRWAMSVRRK